MIAILVPTLPLLKSLDRSTSLGTVDTMDYKYNSKKKKKKYYMIGSVVNVCRDGF